MQRKALLQTSDFWRLDPDPQSLGDCLLISFGLGSGARKGCMPSRALVRSLGTSTAGMSSSSSASLPLWPVLLPPVLGRLPRGAPLEPQPVGLSLVSSHFPSCPFPGRELPMASGAGIDCRPLQTRPSVLTWPQGPQRLFLVWPAFLADVLDVVS